ncbi:MAG: hydrogenase maturation protease [Phycisphaerales bacterium]|nr:hydrogenase maturation protease [Phycisphaerales bacterium]
MTMTTEADAGAGAIEPAAPDVLIIGCGRSSRRDDQFGLHVAARLAEAPPAGVRVLATEAPGADLLTNLEGIRLLVIVDAAHGGETGRWRRLVFAGAGPIDRAGALLDVGLRSLHSSHLIGVAEALRIGEELEMLPPQIWIYAAAGEDFGYGEEMTGPVARAAGEVVWQIRSDVVEWQARRGLCHA